MTNDCPICVQGIGVGTAVVGGILLVVVGAVLASLVWWVRLLGAPMPPSLPHIRAAWSRMVWRRPGTWGSLAVWAWIVLREVWRHTTRKTRQVRRNANGQRSHAPSFDRAVADSNDETVMLDQHQQGVGRG